MLQGGKQPLHYASEGGHNETARMLSEKGAAVDAFDQVGTWECGHVHKHGHAWESAGPLVRAVCGMLQRGHQGQVIHPWCCAAVWIAAVALCQQRRTH